MCERERDGGGLPCVNETAKTRICDIAHSWEDPNLHFVVSVEESHSNGDMAVGGLSLNWRLKIRY